MFFFHIKLARLYFSDRVLVLFLVQIRQFFFVSVSCGSVWCRTHTHAEHMYDESISMYDCGIKIWTTYSVSGMVGLDQKVFDIEFVYSFDFEWLRLNGLFHS